MPTRPTAPAPSSPASRCTSRNPSSRRSWRQWWPTWPGCGDVSGAAGLRGRVRAMRSALLALLLEKPAVALIKAEVRGDVPMNCGGGPVTVSPPPFVETGTAWLIDGRGYLITNAHVVEPAYRMPPWVTHELKK